MHSFLGKMKWVLYIWPLCAILPFLYAVDADYFFSSPLRTHLSSTCTNRASIGCRTRCGTEYGICLTHKCYCLSITLSDYSSDDFEQEANEMVEEYEPVTQRITYKVLKGPNNIELYKTKPTLRHHIAHFCPDLDEARACIKKCMKEGKPAFCGKDHVCYCGHRYHHADNDTEYNPAEAYAGFKDLYQKYFGDNDGSDENASRQ